MAKPKELPTGIAKARYETLKLTRNTALDRARANSKLTIPGLVPEDGQDANASFEQPYQSLGARAVNNLAAWLLVTLFPPDQHFFRLSIHEDAAEGLGSELSDAEAALARISGKAQLLVETSASRPVFMETARHLIIAGNALLYFPLEGGPPRMYRLDQYALLRDHQGRLIEAVIHEQVYPASLPPETLAACGVDVAEGEAKTKKLDLYTHIRVSGEDMVHHQEINAKVVPDSEGKSPRDSSGWMALRWQSVPGSDYGRAHVSEYIGDLLSLEDLNKAIVQFAAVASRIIYLVDPQSMIDVDDLAQAETGDFLSGDADRVKAVQLDKTMDFRVASEVAERIELRLSHAFMLQSGTVRNAERVTAEEIRAMAEELENVLGGVYTVLSAEFQLPLVRRLLYLLERSNEAPKLPKSVIPMIVTGFEAMGRNHSANKLRAWMADMTDIYGPEVVRKITDPSEVGKRFGVSYGIEALDALIKSPEALQQEAQAEAAQQTMQQAAPQAVKAVVDQAAQAQPEEGTA
ncbi:portal protein [Alteriqipengyuania flavescens]|uniref:portal protein n=1 Tax=Alteriqipengyuania flavescens TaxID=3053610 RepID=UPI0025B2A9A4|nr:portal protein [Alteriqipengyuania flavescens]WJY17669.1 portal protein [Alteriqipengyuania flavescens]WJY23612.1 portal protein [Alteriqipengyuania flavescens]